MLSSIQITKEDLSAVDVAEIASSLRTNHVALLILRQCTMADADFEKLASGLAYCRSIIQLTLNIGIVSNIHRITWLGKALEKNKSLQRLHLHGSPLGNDGLTNLMPGLLTHPTLSDIDVGDCQLGDEAIRDIAALIIEREKKARPIIDLALSANQDVTAKGWTSLIAAVATARYLRGLYLDYTQQGDYGAGIISVMLASNRSLLRLDMEGTGITDNGADLILHTLYSFPTSLMQFNVEENDIHEEICMEIRNCLNENRDDASSDEEPVASTKYGTSSLSFGATTTHTYREESEESEESGDQSDRVDVDNTYLIRKRETESDEEEDRRDIASRLRLIQEETSSKRDYVDGKKRNKPKRVLNEDRFPIRSKKKEIKRNAEDESEKTEVHVHYTPTVGENSYYSKENKPIAEEDVTKSEESGSDDHNKTITNEPENNSMDNKVASTITDHSVDHNDADSGSHNDEVVCDNEDISGDAGDNSSQEDDHSDNNRPQPTATEVRDDQNTDDNADDASKGSDRSDENYHRHASIEAEEPNSNEANVHRSDSQSSDNISRSKNNDIRKKTNRPNKNVHEIGDDDEDEDEDETDAKPRYKNTRNGRFRIE